MFAIAIVNTNNHHLSVNSLFASKGKEKSVIVKAVSLSDRQQWHKPDGGEGPAYCLGLCRCKTPYSRKFTFHLVS